MNPFDPMLMTAWKNSTFTN